ncbi:OmpA family protein [Microvirga aerophila]|uniref:OmpA-like domain-containing protein n=1 Tax=Microvirga aerophila TaxID=670291 RepID=A0A512BVK8_9HYPH|nr:OmpA family protein [Microvirga aerophila]GEO15994.1 hypothetical protein MAE02_36900 [Microvirga aerophila]
MSLSKILTDNRSSAPKEEHWIPLSDLMTGLMMMFMLVAVLFMVNVDAEKAKVEESNSKLHDLMRETEQQANQVKGIARLYDEMREHLYMELAREFSSDLPRWKAVLDRDLTIRFQEPEVLFDVGKAVVKPQFARILGDFFPRYIQILASDKYRDGIEEIRIEGHTSSVWNTQTPGDIAYFRNMELSQSRTRSTLEYVLLLPVVADQKHWLTARLTANGLSSSRLRMNTDGTENREASQRVEFRVRTNAEARLRDILEAAAQ